jgi:hypothetical protein
VSNKSDVDAQEEKTPVEYGKPNACTDYLCVLPRFHKEHGEPDCKFVKKSESLKSEEYFNTTEERFTGPSLDPTDDLDDDTSIWGKYPSMSSYSGSSGKYKSSSVGTWQPKCRHEPTGCFKVKDTDVTYCGGSKDKVDVYDFDGLVVCLLGDSTPLDEPIDIQSTGDWAKVLQPHMYKPPKLKNFISIDWPDMSEPPVEPGFFKALHESVLKKKLKKVLFYCFGGHGRTGTALASVLIEVCDFSAEQATKWVHKHYCKEAIESSTQKKWLKDLADVK